MSEIFVEILASIVFGVQLTLAAYGYMFEIHPRLVGRWRRFKRDRMRKKVAILRVKVREKYPYAVLNCDEYAWFIDLKIPEHIDGGKHWRCENCPSQLECLSLGRKHFGQLPGISFADMMNENTYGVTGFTRDDLEGELLTWTKAAKELGIIKGKRYIR